MPSLRPRAPSTKISLIPLFIASNKLFSFTKWFSEADLEIKIGLFSKYVILCRRVSSVVDHSSADPKVRGRFRAGLILGSWVVIMFFFFFFFFPKKLHTTLRLLVSKPVFQWLPVWTLTWCHLKSSIDIT